MQCAADEIVHSYDEFKHHFTLGDLLLSGGQGAIYSTRYAQRGSSYNLITKRVSIRGQHSSEDALIKTVQEFIIQRGLNFMHYHGISFDGDKNSVLLTMEMLEYTLADAVDFHLDAHLHDFECYRSELGLKYFMLEVASFLAQLHGAGFVHLDIKPENVMFRNDRNESTLFNGNGFKVIDLGLAEHIGHKRDCVDMDCYVGTLGYSAPEMNVFASAQRKSHVTFKADIWSLAATILFVLNGYNLFDRVSKKSEKTDTRNKLEKYSEYVEKLENRDLINSHLLSLYLVNRISFHLYDLLSQMLEYNPKSRLSAREVLTHPLFADLVFQGKDGELYCSANQRRRASKPREVVPLTQSVQINMSVTSDD